MMWQQERVDERYRILCHWMHPIDANDVARMLEYRCVCHERLGGVTVIYGDYWLDAMRWADLYRRVCTHLNGEHALKMRAVIDRLEIVVP